LFGCRAVLILTEVLLLLMPLTEHFFRWDRFLQGGPDVEFGVLSLLLFAGLVLLTSYRAVTSPFLVLLAYRLIALPLRRLSTFGHFSLASSFLPWTSQAGNASRRLAPHRNPAPDLISHSSSIVSASPVGDKQY
jgi:hypothetical protein